MATNQVQATTATTISGSVTDPDLAVGGDVGTAAGLSATSAEGAVLEVGAFGDAPQVSDAGRERVTLLVASAWGQDVTEGDQVELSLVVGGGSPVVLGSLTAGADEPTAMRMRRLQIVDQVGEVPESDLAVRIGLTTASEASSFKVFGVGLEIEGEAAVPTVEEIRADILARATASFDASYERATAALLRVATEFGCKDQAERQALFTAALAGTPASEARATLGRRVASEFRRELRDLGGRSALTVSDEPSP